MLTHVSIIDCTRSGLACAGYARARHTCAHRPAGKARTYRKLISPEKACCAFSLRAWRGLTRSCGKEEIRAFFPPLPSSQHAAPGVPRTHQAEKGHESSTGRGVGETLEASLA